MLKTNKIAGFPDESNPPALTLSPRDGTRSERELRRTFHAAFTHVPEKKRETALGLLLLWHDHWDAAHAIAQKHEGESDFDLLHALVHRREGDYANSEYWFRETGRHPLFDLLAARLAPLLESDGVLRRKILPDGKWNPKVFVAAVKTKPDDALLREIQAEEFLCFFGWLTG